MNFPTYRRPLPAGDDGPPDPDASRQVLGSRHPHHGRDRAARAAPAGGGRRADGPGVAHPRALEAAGRGLLLRGPPITIGKSNEHTGFPGTLIISSETLRAQILAVAHQANAWGFRSLAVINTHGGNVPVLVPTLREMRSLYGFRAAVLASRAITELSPLEATFGIHANEAETSWILAAAGPARRHVQGRLRVPGPP
jgi:hypothetical protein